MPPNVNANRKSLMWSRGDYMELRNGSRDCICSVFFDGSPDVGQWKLFSISYRKIKSALKVLSLERKIIPLKLYFKLTVCRHQQRGFHVRGNL